MILRALFISIAFTSTAFAQIDRTLTELELKRRLVQVNKDQGSLFSRIEIKKQFASRIQDHTELEIRDSPLNPTVVSIPTVSMPTANGNTKPTIGMADLVILIERSTQQLKVFDSKLNGISDVQGNMIWPVSTGRGSLETTTSGNTYSTETPSGTYKPFQLAQTFESTTWNTSFPNAIFFKETFAIHGVEDENKLQKLGTAVSGGNIRISAENSKKLFDLATNRSVIIVIY